MERGKYVVIEGQDATGKSTQVEILKSRLANIGISSIVFEEPGGNPVADRIRPIIKDASLEKDTLTEFLLFSASRCELWRSIGRHAISSGEWILSARSYISSHAYQGFGRGLDRSFIDKVTKFATSEDIIPISNKIIDENSEYAKFNQNWNTFNAIQKVINDTEKPRHIMAQNILYLAARCEMIKQLGGVAIRDSAINEYLDLREPADTDYIYPDFEFMLLLLDEEERKRRLGIRGAPEKPDTFESLPQSFQDIVSSSYITIAKERNMKIIRAENKREEVADEIWENIFPKI